MRPGYTIGVDVFDREDDRSDVVSTTVSTSACPDTAAPSAPAGVRQVATTESSVMLAWTPSSDNVGVVEYGLYDSGLRVASVSDPTATVTNLACGKTYLLGIDAADAAGNRSARVDSYFKTSACPSTNKPPTTPTVVKVTSATDTTVGLSWTASTDDVGVTGYGLYLSGARTTETTGTTGQFTGLKCGTTYTLAVDAKDAEGLRSAPATLSAATSPCSPTTPPSSSTGSITQTIANGATLKGVVSWYAVYDANGDKVEDDPGSVEWRIDGNLVRTEVDVPFGDDASFWPSTSVANGTHTFEVRAVNGAGTVLAKNTVTATVANTTPSSSTGSITQTIANGATLKGVVSWYAVYDANGDKVEDDPGSVEWRIDGNLVRTEVDVPFGDDASFWPSTSVANGTHTFEVRAVNGAGTVLAKNTVTATVANTTPPPSTGDTVAPSQPANLKVMSASATNVGVAWSPSTDNVGVTAYDVYRGSTLTATTPQTNATLTGLSCGNAYQVGVDANDAAGNSSPPASMAVTTSPCPDSQAPSAPTNVTASSRTTTSIALTWAPATDSVGVAGYGIYNAGELVNTTAGTTGIVSGLTCGTNYTLAVDAFDATGNSSTKTIVMVSTLPRVDTVRSDGHVDGADERRNGERHDQPGRHCHGQRRRDQGRVPARRCGVRTGHHVAVLDVLEHDHGHERCPHTRRTRIRRRRQHGNSGKRHGHRGQRNSGHIGSLGHRVLADERRNGEWNDQPGRHRDGQHRRNQGRVPARRCRVRAGHHVAVHGVLGHDHGHERRPHTRRTRIRHRRQRRQRNQRDGHGIERASVTWLQPQRHHRQLRYTGRRRHCWANRVLGQRQLRHIHGHQQGDHHRSSQWS